MLQIIFQIQFSGLDSINTAQEVAAATIHESGAFSGCIHTSENSQQSKMEIKNLFQFANMQLGL